MNAALAEDLLVFGVNNQGLAASVYLSGSYEAGSVPATLAPDAREYKLRFESGNYSLVDIATNTEVAAGVFDTTTRAIQYGNWTVSLSGIPADLDEYTIQPTDEPLGDNRIAAALANLQGNRAMLASKQTVQQEYENLVNRVGAITVQAEIAKDAQQVVFDHAREGRDQISGVNLDEELADLLRYQQAYQANAQVIQVANRLFDSLLQRL
jgi:flagellar hook-associated protein 1 FlgK